MNVNYLQETDRKCQLNSLLNSYNLSSIVQFPTRTYKNSISAIDNIYIDTTKIDTYEVTPVINGLSDHDAQFLKIKINLNTLDNNKSHQYQTNFRRNINKYSMEELKNSLSYESWEQVFDSNNVNEMFNSFFNTYLRIFCASFPLKKINHNIKTPWITTGIKTSCMQKRKLYLLSRNSTNQHIKDHYKHYCKILSKVIRETKKRHYDKQIKNSTNKNKTTWDIVNKETHSKAHSTNIQHLNTDGITTDNPQLIAETFNNHFTSVAGNVRTTNSNTYTQNKKCSRCYR
jgi:hypothetical protein